MKFCPASFDIEIVQARVKISYNEERVGPVFGGRGNTTIKEWTFITTLRKIGRKQPNTAFQANV